ncbi:MAG: DUF1385 domain-containing protein [Actinobacteria bacterium]|nr:DUF1385 domain-containing protein [Actinomycetota bacterium]
MAEFRVGGQAVIEGVMMRGEREWSVAVRTPDGEIVRTKQSVGSLLERYPILKKPLLRGIVSLVETLVLGVKALSYSANASLGAKDEEITAISSKEWAATFALAVVVTVGLFMLAPYYLTRFVAQGAGNRVFFAMVEGLFRITIFLGYIAVISRMKDIKRVFQYHGAEHKVINALEAGRVLTPENAAEYSTQNVRCGTSFLLIVMVLAIFTFSFLPTASVFQRVIGKILLIPVIAGVGYELFKFAARHLDSRVVKVLVWPGLTLQKLTTREPDHAQLEVAVAALQEVLPAEDMEPAKA